MTGMFVRIQRDGPQGPSRPVDLDEMTDAELDSLDALMARQEAWMLWTHVKALARYIREHRDAAPDVLDDDKCPYCGRLGNGEPCAPYCGAELDAQP